MLIHISWELRVMKCYHCHAKRIIVLRMYDPPQRRSRTIIDAGGAGYRPMTFGAMGSCMLRSAPTTPHAMIFFTERYAISGVTQ